MKLWCFIAVDLKAGKFQPEYAGQTNFYLLAVDDILRHPEYQQIWVVLCKDKNKVVAEYSLRDMSKPIGVSGFKMTEALLIQLNGSLHSIEDLESGLRNPSGDAEIELLITE